jgi:hypothetical protein
MSKKKDTKILDDLKLFLRTVDKDKIRRELERDE